jgi:salicylate hydroxylase
MKVIIVGAGISGLTLAARPGSAGPRIEVESYEGDAAADARRKGYAIGLKTDAGLSVLERLGLLDDVLSIGAEQVTNFVITDRQGRTLLALPSGNNTRHQTYRVQRDHLQSALADTLTTTPVHFGFQALGYETIDIRHRVVFTGGRHVDGDVVVGCHGVASVLRRQIVDDSPHFLGLSAITGDSALTVDDPLLGGGYFMTLGDRGDSFFCYRQPGGVHFSYTSPTPAALESTSQPDLLRQVREATVHWHPLIGAIVSAADPDSVKPRGYFDRNPTKQIRDGNVWLIGDAAHPMSPFQGQGANTAMLDALELSELLGSGNLAADAEHLAAGIAARGRKAVLESRRAARLFHSTGRFQTMNRNLGFRVANAMINSRLVRRRPAAAVSPRT